MRLIRSERSNKFCGPAALALITGRPVDEMVAIVKSYRWKSYRRDSRWPVKGMRNKEMVEILFNCGFDIVKMASHVDKQYGTEPTLAKWLRLTRVIRNPRPTLAFLVNVTGHYIVVCGRKIYDNHNPDGVFLRQYRHRRVRVKNAWECIKVRDVALTGA